MKPEIKKIYDDWKEAHLNAYGRSAPIDSGYYRGLFHIQGVKYHAHEVVAMTERLRRYVQRETIRHD